LVVVCADGGADVGLGHIARSTAVACALEQLGVEVVCRGLGLNDPLEIDAMRWQPWPPDGVDAGEGAAAAVVDSYRAPPRVVAGSATPLVCMHDRGEVPADAALVVAPAAVDQGDARRLTGLRHACLRRDFWGCPPKEIGAGIRRILVTTGGGALAEAGVRLATDAARACPDAEVAIVVGPYADLAIPAGVEAIVAPVSLREPLDRADVVITAAGQTALEAAATGTPAIVSVIVENQRRNAATLVAAGTAVALEPDTPAGTLDGLLDQLGDSAVRTPMSGAGQAAVDGRGAFRVAAAVAELASS
jgi:spore coat polysaccharide biosynthesis predicted glycosyltransferase SpsG